jgi:hypothetical protein
VFPFLQFAVHNTYILLIYVLAGGKRGGGEAEEYDDE